jgi:hypothetical protein
MTANRDEKVLAACLGIEELGFSLDELEGAAKNKWVVVESDKIQQRAGQLYCGRCRG